MWGDRCVHQPYCGHHYTIYIKLTPCDGSVIFQWSWGKRGKRKIKHITVGPVAKTPCSQCRGPGFDVWSGQWHPTPVLLPGKSHGWRSLVGVHGVSKSQTRLSEWLHFHFPLSYIGEGTDNPLQCSCLENPRDGEPGGLLSMGLHRVGHDWSNLVAAAAGN